MQHRLQDSSQFPGGAEADNITMELIKRISSTFDKGPKDAEETQKWMSNRVSTLSAYPDVIVEETFGIFKGASGDHSLAILDLLNLTQEKCDPLTTIRLLKGQSSWVSAIQLYRTAIALKD